MYDALLTPNLRVGLRLSPHWSMGLTAGYRPWPTDDNTTRKWKHLLVSPDLRYWTDSVNVHHFFGVNLIYSHFNLANIKFPFGLYKGLRDERRQGDLGAIGAFYGYSWPLGRHWNIEALIGAAVGYMKYDRYACGKCGTKIGDDHKIFVVPQAALNIVFNIPGRPKKVVQPVEPIEPIQPIKPTEPAQPIEPVQPVIIAEPKERAIDVLRRQEPVIAHISEYQPYDRSQALRNTPGVLYVYFPVAKYTIREDYRDNAATLQRILDITNQVMADSSCSVKKIQIVGFASVDGGQWGNERLALRRANALKKYVQQYVSLPDEVFEVSCGGEAWADLNDHINQLIADYQGTGNKSIVAQLRQAQKLIKQERDPVRREQRLRTLNGGRTWRYIRKVFNDHRNAGYLRLYFDYVENEQK